LVEKDSTLEAAIAEKDDKQNQAVARIDKEITDLKKRCSDIDGKMDGEGNKSLSAMDLLKEKLDALTAKTDDLQTKLQQKDE
jgi:hypothetical protein